MTGRPPTPRGRLERAVARSELFAGFQSAFGDALPAIAMPMHLALDAYSLVVSPTGGGAPVFAKAYRDGALAPFDFAGAAAAAARAGEAGIGPRLLDADSENDVLFFEALGTDWRMTLARDTQKADTKAAIIAAKKAWHGQPLLARTLSPFDLARDYCERLEPSFSSAADGHLPFKGLLPWPSVRQWIFRIEEALAAAGSDTHPVHGESTVSNIMTGPQGSILLVDFDRAANADPLFDLGGLCLDLCRSEDERMEAVEMYAGHADTAVLARIKLYGLVDDFLWGCWAMLAEQDTGTHGPELFKYGSNRFLRLSHHLQQFDLPLLLAKV